MKVLDLQCGHGHPFEGWFASEDDYLEQKGRSLVQCPVCGDSQVVKKLSAPRLNLSGARSAPPDQAPAPASGNTLALAKPQDADALAAWLEMSRKLMASTTDVGSQFAEEARKIHYGEAPERAIRGQATARETRELLDEGIAVLPLLLPDAAKGTLQ